MIPELRMRERELKKEWIDAARETKQRQRAQRQSELSEVRRNVRRGVLAFEWNWAEVGFSIKSNGVFCTFFFWISAWFQANQPESKLHWLASVRVGENNVEYMWHDVAGCGGTRGQRRPMRVAASDTGAAPLVSRLCFLGDLWGLRALWSLLWKRT